MSNILKKYGYYLILAVIFALGFFLRLKWLIANPSFWDDECSIAWNVVHKNYSDFFSVLAYTQVAPPFFMITAKFFTKIFGVSDFVLRLTPFLFGILSMIMFLLVSNKLFENKITVVISNLIFSINQALVNYSSEFKQYSCDVFFTLLCFYLFINLLGKSSFRKNLAYAFIFSISLWFSFVSVFIISAGLLVILIKQLKEKSFNLKNFSALLFPIFANCIFYLWFYIIKTYTENITELNNYWANSYIARDFSNLGMLLKNVINYFMFPSNFLLLIVLAMVIGLIVLFKKRFYLTLILTLTVVFEGFASWLGLYPFEKRVVLFLLPIVLIFISAIFELFNPKQKLKSAVVSLLFILIFFQSFVYCRAYIKTPKPTRGYYSREMMEVMLSKIKPGDIIVVNRYSRTDFAYYATYHKIKNKVIQEGQTGNRQAFLNSLNPGYYWFYMPFGPSPTYDKWFADKKRHVLFELNGNGYPSKMVYLKSD
ncbi:MAG: glycosyltransferase family 39 protein [Candidatus Gastranaerophilales bacterium]|nr:glycosyltransferase family 39 protein [Candidatus Gastranaerophilales bacterium]